MIRLASFGLACVPFPHRSSAGWCRAMMLLVGLLMLAGVSSAETRHPARALPAPRPVARSESLGTWLARKLSSPTNTVAIASATCDLQRGLTLDGLTSRPSSPPGSPSSGALSISHLGFQASPYSLLRLTTAPDPARRYAELVSWLLPDEDHIWPVHLDIADLRAPGVAIPSIRFTRKDDVLLEAQVKEPRVATVRVHISPSRAHLQVELTLPESDMQRVLALLQQGRGMFAAGQTGMPASLRSLFASLKQQTDGNRISLEATLPTVELRADLLRLSGRGSAASANGTSPAPVPPGSRGPGPASAESPSPRVLVRLSPDSATTTGPLPRPLALEGGLLLPFPADVIAVEVGGKRLESLPVESSRERLLKTVVRTLDPSYLAYLGCRLYPVSEPLPPQVTVQTPFAAHHALRMYTCPLVQPPRISITKGARPVRVEVTTGAGAVLVYALDGGGEALLKPDRPPFVTETSVDPAGGIRLLMSPRGGTGGAPTVDLDAFTWADHAGSTAFAAFAWGQGDRGLELKRDVVFVVDVSGSMSGEKIEQARNTLSTCLGRLGPADRFGIVSFSDDVQSFNAELMPASGTRIRQARAWVHDLTTRAGTNLHDGALAGFRMLPAAQHGRTSMVILLTDGEPTSGVTDEGQIVSALTTASSGAIGCHPIGLGHDVNTRLLDRIAAGTRAGSAYVRPTEPIEPAVEKVFAGLSHPVARDLKLQVIGAAPVSLPPAGQMLHANGWRIFTGRFQSVPGDRPALVLTGTTGAGPFRVERSLGDLPGDSHRWSFVPCMVAQRRLGELMEQARLRPLDDLRQEEVMVLSLRHGIDTPLTHDLIQERAARRSALGVDLKDALDQRRRLSSRATSAFKALTGAQALEDAVAIQKLRTLDGVRQVTSLETRVERGGKVFVHRPGRVWMDADYQGRGRPERVVFGSPAYVELLARRPELGPWLSVGSEVVLSDGPTDLLVTAPPGRLSTTRPKTAGHGLTALAPADFGVVAIDDAAALARLDGFLSDWNLGAMRLWESRRTFPGFLDDLGAALHLPRELMHGKGRPELAGRVLFLFADLGFTAGSRLGVLVEPRDPAAWDLYLARRTSAPGPGWISTQETLDGVPVQVLKGAAGDVFFVKVPPPPGVPNAPVLVTGHRWVVQRVLACARGLCPSLASKRLTELPRSLAFAHLDRDCLGRILSEVVGDSRPALCQEAREQLARLLTLYREDHPRSGPADVEELESAGYLLTPPLCPGGGTLSGAGSIRCSIHCGSGGAASPQVAGAGGSPVRWPVSSQQDEAAVDPRTPLPLERFELSFHGLAGGMAMNMDVVPGAAAQLAALGTFRAPVSIEESGALPAGAILAADLDLDPYLKELAGSPPPDGEALVPGLARVLPAVESALGIRASRDILAWMGRTAGLALYPARPEAGVPGLPAGAPEKLPDVLLTLPVEDEARARAALEDLVPRLARFCGVEGQEQRASAGPATIWKLRLPFLPTGPAAALVDGHLLLSNDTGLLERALAARARLAPRLDASPWFVRAVASLDREAHARLLLAPDAVGVLRRVSTSLGASPENPGGATAGLPSALRSGATLAGTVRLSATAMQSRIVCLDRR